MGQVRGFWRWDLHVFLQDRWDRYLNPAWDISHQTRDSFTWSKGFLIGHLSERVIFKTEDLGYASFLRIWQMSCERLSDLTGVTSSILPGVSEEDSAGELSLGRFALEGPISSRLSAIVLSRFTKKHVKAINASSNSPGGGTKRNKSNQPSGFFYYYSAIRGQ